MDIAEKAARYVVKIEGRDKETDKYNYGISQAWLDECKRLSYVRKQYKQIDVYNSEELAVSIYTEAFNTAKFNLFTKENVAVFMFDTWVQNPKTYRAILATMCNTEYFPLAEYKMPYNQKVYDDVNASEANDFIATAAWIRHHITIFAHDKSDWQGIWNKRTIPLLKVYPLTCYTSQSGLLLMKASDYSRNNDFHAKIKTYRYDDAKELKQKLIAVFTAAKLPNIGKIFAITDCMMPIQAQTTESEDNLLQNAALGFLAVYIFKKIFL